MAATERDRRFFASTRGRVVLLLQRGNRTVDELARALGLTDNAVRAHLAALERDGLVTQGELRRGGSGKPSFTYLLTPGAERLFPKAYGMLLNELLQVLGERLPSDDVAETLRAVGHRVAAMQAMPSGDMHDRVERAVTVLSELGGMAEAEEVNGGFLIRGHSCPLAAAVDATPQACLLAEALLSDVIGVPVRQACDQASPPRCRFEVPASSA